MPYQDKNTRVSRAFSPNSGGNARPARARTMTVEVLSYDVKNAAIIGKTKLANGEDQILEITINADTVARQRASDARKAEANQNNSDAGRFSGAYIDQKMSEALPAGSLIQVERAVRIKSVKIGSETRQVVEANWIHHVPDNNPDKVIDAPITLSAYQGRGTSSRAYTGSRTFDATAPQAGEKIVRSFSTETEEGEKAISALADAMDQAVEHYDPKSYQPRIGVRFVAVRTTDREKEIYNTAEGKKVPTKIAEVVSRTFHYDWQELEPTIDANGNEQRNGRPISGSEMLDSLNGYIQYVEESFGKGNAHVEVRPYEVLRNSKTDKSFDGSQGSKNWKVVNLVSTPGKLDQGEDEQFYTGYYGVQGSLLIMADKIDKGKVAKQFLATRLFADGFSADIDELIQTENGSVVEVIPALRAVPADTRQNANTASNAGGGAPQGERFTSSLAADTDDNPFGTDTNDAFGSDGQDSYAARFDEAKDAPAAAPAAEAPAAEQQPRSRLRR